MLYSIANDTLTVIINSFGGELHSIKSADGTQYLWQPDPEIWTDQAPNIFPYVARLTDQTYELNGKRYPMMIHGFAHKTELEAETASALDEVEGSSESISFCLKDNNETYVQYPFHFVYRITYTLNGNVLSVTNEVETRDNQTMYFGIGGHPGFNVPLEKELSFSDYHLEFAEDCHPTRVGFTEDCFVNGHHELYPLEENRKLPLHHDLFDNDAIVLYHTARKVTLRSDKGSRAVEVSYPYYPLIGFWHKPKSEVPYVCIEPWSSLPSRKGIVENLSQQADLIHLPARDSY